MSHRFRERACHALAQARTRSETTTLSSVIPQLASTTIRRAHSTRHKRQMELRLNRQSIMAVDRLSSGSSSGTMAKLETQNFDDDASLADTASVDSCDGVPDASSFSLPVHKILERRAICKGAMAACPFCCQRELKMYNRGGNTTSKEVFYTRCQVRGHDSESSCWLVAGDVVYDATSLLKSHPGGKECIMRKAGGVADCSMDIYFHSQRGRAMWERQRIGRLVECGKEPSSNTQWWMFWLKD